MDRHIVQLLLLDTIELDQLIMIMGNLAAGVIGALEDGDFDDGSSWRKVGIELDDFLTMGDPAFRLHFRMTRTTFERLVEILGNHLVQMNRLQREKTPLQLILMEVLWIMATPDSFRSVALQFGVVPGTIHYHYLYIIEALRELAPRFITWPTARELEETKEYFERATGFPGVIGCLDGIHHYITAPLNDKVRYVNRHDSHSVHTQCVCDHRLLIRDFYVGEPGSMHDSRVFRRSPLCRNLLEDGDMMNMDEHILGDGGYILTNHVLIPFRNNGNLSELQRNYNRIHAQVRVRIENCFFRAKLMWRRAKFLHAMSQDIVVDHIVASLVLHNFVILNGEEMENLEAVAIQLEEGELDEVEEEDLGEIDVDYPNVETEPDHPRMEDAREWGVEKRLHVMRNLPRIYA